MKELACGVLDWVGMDILENEWLGYVVRRSDAIRDL